jgi:hypothetical protein
MATTGRERGSTASAKEATVIAAQALNGRMPRYFFDVHDPRITLKDDDGMELPDLDAACREATIAAAEMIKSHVPCEHAELALEVRDENGTPACVVTLAVRVSKPSDQDAPGDMGS